MYSLSRSFAWQQGSSLCTNLFMFYSDDDVRVLVVSGDHRPRVDKLVVLVTVSGDQTQYVRCIVDFEHRIDECFDARANRSAFTSFRPECRWVTPRCSTRRRSCLSLRETT
jgi:hypothetical protein